MAIYQQR